MGRGTMMDQPAEQLAGLGAPAGQPRRDVDAMVPAPWSSGRVRRFVRQLLEAPRGAVVLEVETTTKVASATSPLRLVEVTAIDTTGAVVLATRVQPELSVPSAATLVHGVSDADCLGAPRLVELWPRLVAAIAERPVVAWNVPFVRGALMGHVGGERELGVDWHDAMRWHQVAHCYARPSRLVEACASARLDRTPTRWRSQLDAECILALMRQLAGLTD